MITEQKFQHAQNLLKSFRSFSQNLYCILYILIQPTALRHHINGCHE